MMMILAQAAATAAPAAGGPQSALMGFAPMVAILLVFYFLLMRPQIKQQKQQRQMIADARKGDEIVTLGGVYGKIIEAQTDVVMVQVADGVTVKLDRSGIQRVKGYTDTKSKAA